MESALEGLPATFREVLVLLEQEGLSYNQVADMLGIPIGTVMSRAARARRQLRESLRLRVSLQSKPQDRQLRNQQLSSAGESPGDNAIASR